MRIAVLADIHGNLAAFEAALDHVTRQRVDQVVIAGDIVVGSPDSAACWRLAQGLGCPILRGNHERYVAHYGTPSATPEWSTERFAPVQWAAAQLADDERRAIAQRQLRLSLPDLPDLLIVHASLRSDHDGVMAYTSDEQLAAMFPGVRERVIVRARPRRAGAAVGRSHRRHGRLGRPAARRPPAAPRATIGGGCSPAMA